MCLSGNAEATRTEFSIESLLPPENVVRCQGDLLAFD